MYCILSKIFPDIDSCVKIKQRKGNLDSRAVYLNIHKHFLGSDHMTKQAKEAERMHYDEKKVRWDWDKYVSLHK